jgi:hypothetical protein
MSISWAEPHACIFASSAAVILFTTPFVLLFRKDLGRVVRLGKGFARKHIFLGLPAEGLQPLFRAGQFPSVPTSSSRMPKNDQGKARNPALGQDDVHTSLGLALTQPYGMGGMPGKDNGHVLTNGSRTSCAGRPRF